MPPMSLKLQHNTASKIMITLSETLSSSGATIIGGHSSIGAEMTIGLTLTGLVEHPITLAGARAGDVLILTKPLGSGTIMAAEMQLEARGADVAECLGCMVQSQQKASEILSPHAHAMTDVTGFGLAGHATHFCSLERRNFALEYSSSSSCHSLNSAPETSSIELCLII